MAKNAVDMQAKELVKDYIKNHLYGSTEDKIRNKLGNKVWPLTQKFTKYCSIAAPLSALAAVALGNPISSSLPGLFSVSVTGLAASHWASGHVKFLQNIALRQSAVFGATLRRKGVPDAVRKKAVEQFFKSQSPLFTAKNYIKKHPDMLARMQDGKLPDLNRNFVSVFEENNDKLAKKITKEKRNATFAERMANYKKSYSEFKAAQKEVKLAQQAAISAPRSIAEAAQSASVKTLNQTLATSTVQKATTKTTEKAVPTVAKTAAEEATRLPLGKKLVEEISTKTAEKTGSKLLGWAAIKVGAKKIPILGAVFGAAFATGRAIKGDWTGAGMELTSGVASCVPGIGTAASLGIDGALIARDFAGGR